MFASVVATAAEAAVGGVLFEEPENILAAVNVSGRVVGHVELDSGMDDCEGETKCGLFCDVIKSLFVANEEL